MPPALGIAHPFASQHTDAMITTEATAADLALTELHEHLSAIERLARAPFNAERIAVHKAMAMECLDAIAVQLVA